MDRGYGSLPKPCQQLTPCGSALYPCPHTHTSPDRPKPSTFDCSPLSPGPPVRCRSTLQRWQRAARTRRHWPQGTRPLVAWPPLRRACTAPAARGRWARWARRSSCGAASGSCSGSRWTYSRCSLSTWPGTRWDRAAEVRGQSCRAPRVPMGSRTEVLLHRVVLSCRPIVVSPPSIPSLPIS